MDEYCRQGMPGGCTKRKGDQWRFDSAAVVSWLRERERSSALGEVAQIDEGEARRRKVAAEAALVELELAKEQGGGSCCRRLRAGMVADDWGRQGETSRTWANSGARSLCWMIHPSALLRSIPRGTRTGGAASQVSGGKCELLAVFRIRLVRDGKERTQGRRCMPVPDIGENVSRSRAAEGALSIQPEDTGGDEIAMRRPTPTLIDNGKPPCWAG